MWNHQRASEDLEEVADLEVPAASHAPVKVSAPIELHLISKEGQAYCAYAGANTAFQYFDTEGAYKQSSLSHFEMLLLQALEESFKGSHVHEHMECVHSCDEGNATSLRHYPSSLPAQLSSGDQVKRYRCQSPGMALLSCQL